MSVYIKGFPLPNNCGACPLRLAWCRERIYMVNRPERCPLAPFPAHGRLIDADALTISTAVPLNGKPYRYVHIDNIENAPTIIPAEEDEA